MAPSDDHPKNGDRLYFTPKKSLFIFTVTARVTSKNAGYGNLCYLKLKFTVINRPLTMKVLFTRSTYDVNENYIRHIMYYALTPVRLPMPFSLVELVTVRLKWK